MSKISGPAAVLAKVSEETLKDNQKMERVIPGGWGSKSGHISDNYIHPSSLAKGCMQHVAREIMGMPKRELEPRVSRILEVGSERHRRIPSYFRRVIFAREVFFCDEEYKIKGYCDCIVYLPPDLDKEATGFYAVEIKTTGSSEFERIVDEGSPREDHALQCQIYIWGIKRYYKVLPIMGGIIFYENRDTLEHHLFNVPYDEEKIEHLLSRVKAMWEAISEGRLPEDHLPLDHWAHKYCGYLDICDWGKRALRYQKEHRKELPEEVLAEIIAKRILRKRRREGRRREMRSLEELIAQLEWK